ncbi:MAG TPA: DUF6644 family protein [Steroidobacteraceae bacterium]|jgi:hypothetical protein|nr:DUF6644 family protein [Steroidobacteraceae bacterium]
MIREFCRWLAATALSEHIQDIFWVIPTVQIVHIVSIAIVMTSMAMLDLRLVGIAGRRQSLPDMAHRFLPWVWTALVVLLCSGSILIIGEPGRDLLNKVFWLKMSLLAAGVVLTFTFQFMLRRNKTFWDRNRAAAIALGSVSLLIWIGIIGCGRWIAYVEHG